MADALLSRFGFLEATLSYSFSGQVLDISTDAIEIIFQAPEAITITRLWYRFSTITGTSPVFQISLQGVDQTVSPAVPNGTIKSSGNAKATFTPSAGNLNTGQWVNLTSSYTCTRGEMLAIVIQYSSGTINASNSVFFSAIFGSGVMNRPYFIGNNAGVRTVSALTALYGFGSSTKAYGYPIATLNALAFNDGTTPDEYALRFIVPSTWLSTYQIVGFRALVAPNPAASTLTFKLYDGTTVLQTLTLDTDALVGVNALRFLVGYFTDTTLATLTAGNVYRLAVKNDHASTSSTLQTIGVQAQADLDALPLGREWYESNRNNAGAWTDVTTERPLIEPIFADFTAPAAGGVNRALLPSGLSALG